MSAPKIDLDTELSAVNSILGAIGQAPVTKLAQTNDRKVTQGGNTVTIPELEFEDPQVAYVYTILMECNLDTQIHGWVFNTEEWLQMGTTTINSQEQILFGDNILRWDVSDGQVYRTSDVVRRTDPFDSKSKLYDKKHHTYDFTGRTPIHLDVVYKFDWGDLPPAFQRWIVHQASVRCYSAGI